MLDNPVPEGISVNCPLIKEKILCVNTCQLKNYWALGLPRLLMFLLIYILGTKQSADWLVQEL